MNQYISIPYQHSCNSVSCHTTFMCYPLTTPCWCMHLQSFMARISSGQ